VFIERSSTLVFNRSVVEDATVFFGINSLACAMLSRRRFFAEGTEGCDEGDPHGRECAQGLGCS
jgi:hypothetical protein